MVVRKRQLWRVKDCKGVVGEHVNKQHKPVVFVVWMSKRREVKSRGQKIIMGEVLGKRPQSTRRG